MGGTRAQPTHQPPKKGAKPLMGVLVGVLAATLAMSSRTPLEERLDAALKAGPLSSARVAALVVAETDGRVLYAREPDALRVPASNMKVLTAFAALDAFGPTHRFETVITADRPPGANGVVGELGVRGAGDPALNSEDWWRLAADLRRAGLRKVDGDLIVDPSCFDTQYWHPGWGEPSSRAFYAPVAGLSANYGAFFVRVAPGGRAGEPLRVEVDPPLPYLKLVNRGRTTAPGERGTLAVARGGASAAAETIVVSGGLGVGEAPREIPRSVRDPALYAGALFRWQLEAVGIEITGRVRQGEPGHATELRRHPGRSLAEIVRLFLKYSNNSMAETLVKAMGAKAGKGQGDWPGGLAEMRRRLEAHGLLDPDAQIVDGSGLAAANRISPRMLVATLARAREAFRFGPEFVAALPIGGRDGTLEERVGGGADRVRGKTGFLGTPRVVALSGYVEGREGQRVIFSILVNGYRGGAEDAIRAVDAWVAALVDGT